MNASDLTTLSGVLDFATDRASVEIQIDHLLLGGAEAHDEELDDPFERPQNGEDLDGKVSVEEVDIDTDAGVSEVDVGGDGEATAGSEEQEAVDGCEPVVVVELVEHTLAVGLDDGVGVSVTHHVEEADATDAEGGSGEAVDGDLGGKGNEAVTPRSLEVVEEGGLIVGVRGKTLVAARVCVVVPIALRVGVAESLSVSRAVCGVAVDDSRSVARSILVEATIAKEWPLAHTGAVVGRDTACVGSVATIVAVRSVTSSNKEGVCCFARW